MRFRCEAIDLDCRAVVLRAVASSEPGHPNRAIWGDIVAGELELAELDPELVRMTFERGREYLLELRQADEEPTSPGRRREGAA
jgi:hypothetical protein